MTTYTGGDGLSLCSTAHTSKVPGVSNQSNSGTTALSADAWMSTRTLMRKFTDWNGKKIQIIPNMLIAPLDLEKTAEEAVRTQLQVGSANNTVNMANQDGFRPTVMINEWLDTDTNNWFAVDTKYSKVHLHYLNRIPLRLWNDASSTTLVMQFAGYYRCGFGFSDYRWIYGHNVA